MNFDFSAVPGTLPEAAEYYGAHGIPIIPCAPCGSLNAKGQPSKEPLGDLVPHGSKDATTDVMKIRAWWKRHPNANIGIVGASANPPFFVIDIDTHDGVDGFKSIEQAGFKLPETVMAKTPSGGVHAFHKWTSGEKPRQTQSNIRDAKGDKILGVDVRGVNGYVLAFPSRTVRGAYEWTATSSGGMAEFPEWAKRVGASPKARQTKEAQIGTDDLFTARQPLSGDAIKRASAYLAKVAPAVEGQGGHGMLLHAAEVLVVGFNLDDQTALDLLWNEYNPRCIPPWNRSDPNEVREFERKISEARNCTTNISGYLLHDNGGRDRIRPTAKNEAVAEAGPDTFERFGHKVDGDRINGFDTYGREIDGIDGCGSFFVTVNAGRESIRAAVQRNAAEIVKRIVATRSQNKTKGNVEISSSKLHEIENALTVMWLRSRGRLFWNAQTERHEDSLFFDNERGQLFTIESDFFQSWIANLTDVSRSVQQYKTLHALLQDAAVCQNVAAGVIPSKYYDRRGDTLYISNGDSLMVRVTATEISTVRNGTDDVVFLKGATLLPWTLLDGDGEDPFDAAKIFRDAWYLTPSGKMLLRLWYLSLFAKHKKRPPLLITAPFRSGKTALFDGINFLLANKTGANAEITDTPNGKIDFWTAIHAGGLYCIDNADSKVSWLSDTLQRVSTGSALPKRKLYTDDILGYLYPNADIVVTSNNPQFADECGLSDRFTIVRLEKRGERIAKDGELEADILRRRDAALTWTVRTLQRALAVSPDADAGGRINQRHPDFATFALRCADAIGKRQDAEAALVRAELDKAVIVLQTADVARDVFAHLRSVSGVWSGKASDLALQTWQGMSEDPANVRAAGTEVGKALKKYEDQFRACFKFRTARTGGVTFYHFTGMDERLDAASCGE